MTIFETLSIVSICLTAFISLSSVVVPIVTSKMTNKMKLKERELELFHSSIDGLMSAYSEFRINSNHKLNLLSAIYKTMTFCTQETKTKLLSLIEAINKKDSPYLTSDPIFYECISALQKEFNLINTMRKTRRLLK